MSINKIPEKFYSSIDAVLNKWGFGDNNNKRGGGKDTEIKEWLDNFEPSEIEDMLIILENIEVVSQTEVNSMVEVLSKELKKIFKGDFANVKAFPLGNYPSSSGGNFLYSLCKDLGIKGSFTPYEHFSEIDLSIDLSNVKALVFIDDMIGSGSQATRFAKKNLSGLNVDTYFITLFALEEGLEKVRAEAGFTKVIPAKILSGEYKAFSSKSHYFTDPDIRERLKNICKKYGMRLYPDHPLGYEGSQFLLVFPHNVPNNTLPIIWAGPESESEAGVLWKPVWKRKKTYHFKQDKKREKDGYNEKTGIQQSVNVKDSTGVNIMQSGKDITVN